ncbi:MAG: type II toxin-antitoxin system VapC family toxin [Candidatus Hydrothermarchaeaceae archaeon]
MYIFDTTAIIELFKGNENLKDKMEGIGDDFGVTAVSYLEIFSKVRHRKLKREGRYFERFFASVPLYTLDKKAADDGSRVMGDLYKRGAPINITDVMISGIALANGADGIITGDKDFLIVGEVSDLEIVLL